MKTPYVPHLYGEAAQAKLTSRQGWLTVGVASSIPWPQEDVWVLYDDNEYVLRGKKAGEERQAPCISTPCPRGDIDAAQTRCYLFASVLGWFKGGYVDVIGAVWGSGPVLYGSRDAFTTTFDGTKFFNCNYMPVIVDEQTRKALAFMREGKRLRHVHEPYSFLSFFKVVESQFTSKDRVAWIGTNLDLLDGDPAKRVAELKKQGFDVGKHLFESGRCAVAHASLGGAIVDPDIPADRRRIAEDLGVIAGLAARYIKVEAGVPDDSELYESRDRTAPWHGLLPAETLLKLQAGEEIKDLSTLGQLRDNKVSVRLWGREAPECMYDMQLAAEGYGPGVVSFLAVSRRTTVFLRFAVDFANGRIHTLLEEGGVTDQFSEVTEAEVEHSTRYFHSVVANSQVELCIKGVDPVPCEIVIPVNIIPQVPEKMVAAALEQFRRRKAQAASATAGTTMDTHAQVSPLGQSLKAPKSR
ncbi:methylamine utilization protein MauJ [Pantoea sp. 18069]|uniref:methylamine utilization protein MauJ n=1 Tax=Pantoea sp. 18069 TaxID=2681415 RepID=UPI001358C164|nr:methylamine utilization protein MauJ [Pantoea sp. 18069]